MARILIPVLALLTADAHAQLDLQGGMRNPSLAPRPSVSRGAAGSSTTGYTPLDREPTRIERRQRQNLVESRNLEFRSALPEYSRERQQVRDRAYKDFRDVEFIGATLNRDKPVAAEKD